MGEMTVPADALYGATTQRAVENFPVSGRALPRPFLRALGLIKGAAAATNRELGTFDADIADVIEKASAEVAAGDHDAHFPVDVFQTGSGTSTNMNANEVIANRACLILHKPIGSRETVHPNDHVNQGQSSNDVIPTALHISCAEELHARLLPALRKLETALGEKARQFDSIVKIGRTHLQDATPVRLGQVFGGYRAQIENGIGRLEAAQPRLHELALGGTAVGTGINCPPGFAAKTIARIAEMTGLPFVEAPNHFEAQAARDAVVELSGAVRTVAVSLMRIANDIRMLGSGPRCGIGEIKLPVTQPGSSIMPGKVNPVICESVLQVCMRVLGHDAAIVAGGASGLYELNVAIPMMAEAMLDGLHLLANVCTIFVDKCIDGIEADEPRIAALIEQSLMLCTALAPVIGYDTAAALAKRAFAEGKTVREVAEEMGIENLDEILDLRSMTD